MSEVRHVKLLRSHTDVHPDLVVGAIGELKENLGLDPYFRVYFPKIKKSFNLFDNSFEYLLNAKEQLIYDQKVATAYDVVFETGPKGGYRSVTFKYKQPNDGVENIYYRADGIKVLDLFKERGIPVTTIKHPK